MTFSPYRDSAYLPRRTAKKKCLDWKSLSRIRCSRYSPRTHLQPYSVRPIATILQISLERHCLSSTLYRDIGQPILFLPKVLAIDCQSALYLLLQIHSFLTFTTFSCILPRVAVRFWRIFAYCRHSSRNSDRVSRHSFQQRALCSVPTLHRLGDPQSPEPRENPHVWHLKNILCQRNS